MSRILTWLIVVLVIIIGGVLLFSGGEEATAPETSTEITQEQPEASTGTIDEGGKTDAPATDRSIPGTIFITYTDSGFSPAQVNISQGETAVFLNESSRRVWPASAVHPTHTVYPGSEIGKCGGVDASSIFDACQGIEPGESWQFTFTEVGEWGYHDHLRASHTGQIIVR